MVPAAAEQPLAADDSVAFSGGQISEMDIEGCGSGTRSIQHYVLVDPSGSRSPRQEGIVAVSTALPVRPGTTLGFVSFLTACQIGGVAYLRYEGTVQ